MSQKTNQNREVSKEELNDINGGSSLLGGSGSDATNMIGGNIGYTSSDSGSDGQGHSYNESSSKGLNFGAGNMSNSENY